MSSNTTTEAFETSLRAEFEAWAKERGHPLCDVIPKYGPASSAPYTVLRFSDIAWEAYQAATERAAKLGSTRGHLGSTVDGGIDDHDEDRPHQDDSGASQDAGDDASATGAAGGTGENQHHQHRAGQADDQRAGAECDCASAGLPGEDSVREAPDGWRLIKLATTEERSWPEDYAHENGHYFNTCYRCQRQFMGHKRRVACKVCSEPAATHAAAIRAREDGVAG